MADDGGEPDADRAHGGRRAGGDDGVDDLVRDLRDVVRTGLLGGGDADPLADELPGLDVDDGGLDAGAADVQAHGQAGAHSCTPSLGRVSSSGPPR